MRDERDDWLLALPRRAWSAGGLSVVERQLQGSVHVLPSGAASALDRCARAAPSEELARRLGPGGSRAVQQLRESGWLRSLGELRAELRAVPATPRVVIEEILIPTRSWGPQLARLLVELSQHETPVRLMLDDPDPGAARDARAAAAACCPGLKLTVVGADERRVWGQALARASGLPELCASLVPDPRHGWRVGALRNSILLAGAGRAVISVDDDVLPQAVALGAGSPRLGTDPDPTTWRLLGRRDDAWQGMEPVDLASVLGAALGRTAAELVVDGELHRASPGLALRAQIGETVVVATLGIAGDSGGSRTLFTLGLPVDARAQLLADFPEDLQSRALLRAASALSVTDVSWFMAPCFAMDARVLLPPTLPLHRNTDGLWGALVATVRPGLVAHLPQAVRHDPLGDRRLDHRQLAQDVTTLRMTDLLGLFVTGCELSARAPEDRLAQLGWALRGLAATPGGLQAGLHHISRRWGSALLAGLQGCRRAGGPDLWLAELDAAHAALMRWLREAPTIAEHTHDGRHDLPTLQAEIRQLGDLLLGWPQLHDAALRVGPPG